MVPLGTADIRLGARPASKADAIKEAGRLLVEQGAIAPHYVDSMLAREAVATTFLGHGVAIPHGLPKDADDVHATRVAVLQVPHGVDWHDGERAHLVFAIAAQSDEHIGLLVRLTGLLDDVALLDRLAHTNDPREIVAALASEPAEPVVPDAATRADDEAGVARVVRFTNPRGFHLRPATLFARVAKRAGPDHDVTLGVRGKTCDGKSATRIIKLGVVAGDALTVRVRGPRKSNVLAELAATLEQVQHELEEAAPAAAPPPDRWQPAHAATAIIAGTLAAPGLAVAPALVWRRQDLRATSAQPRAPIDVDAERARLRAAVAAARAQLEELAVSARNDVQRSLLAAHAELVADDELLAAADAGVTRGEPAGEAWASAVEALARAVATIGDEHLAKRAVDMRDVGRRVQRLLVPGAPVEGGGGAGALDPLAGVAEPIVLVADDLEPSVAAQLSPNKVHGIALAAGSPNAHAAIVARSLGVPMIVAAGARVLDVAAGTPVILDASGGRLLVGPHGADVESARDAIAARAGGRAAVWEARFAPALLRDGHRVEVVANVGTVNDVVDAVSAGAEGVGLVRTELLYLDRSAPPSEDEQVEVLRGMLAALAGLPLVVRTLDIGGDKPVAYLGLDHKDLSFLGLRGVRLGFARPDLAMAQLRAIFRAARHGPLRILFPMVATPDDFVRARAMAEAARAEVDGPAVELGVMVEVPSAVTMAAELAALVDFFSIGTNDLTQYALAVDRTHPLLADRVDSLHPAVLRLIDETVRGARVHGVPVAVCGSLAADPRGASILAGLGVHELSVPPALVPPVKAALRQATLAELELLARRALAASDAATVHALALPGELPGSEP